MIKIKLFLVGKKIWIQDRNLDTQVGITFDFNWEHNCKHHDGLVKQILQMAAESSFETLCSSYDRNSNDLSYFI